MKALVTVPNSHAHSLVFRHAIIGISLLLLLLPATAQGQSDYVEYYGQSLRINNFGMAVLGSWALANIFVGAYGWSQNTGQRAYFHQMNLFWNTVNLSIAGFALYSNLTAYVWIAAKPQGRFFAAAKLFSHAGCLGPGPHISILKS